MPRGCLRQARFSVGFTLIEMLVALVIAGILLCVALPGYQYAMIKSGRTAARGALLDVVSRQEQYFVNHKRYAISLENFGLGKDYFVDRQGEAVGRRSAVYHIRLYLIDGAYAGVEAIPLNGQTADSGCMTFTLSSVGVRSVSGAHSSNPPECW